MASEKILLKVGDKLFSDSRYHGLTLVTVERLTRTTAILSNNSKVDNPTRDFVRAKGDSGGYGATYYRLATSELMEQYRRQTALRKIAAVKWDEVSTNTINTILDMIIKP